MKGVVSGDSRQRRGRDGRRLPPAPRPAIVAPSRDCSADDDERQRRIRLAARLLATGMLRAARQQRQGNGTAPDAGRASLARGRAGRPPEGAEGVLT